jgi:hypothetical protein
MSWASVSRFLAISLLVSSPPTSGLFYNSTESRLYASFYAAGHWCLLTNASYPILVVACRFTGRVSSHGFQCADGSFLTTQLADSPIDCLLTPTRPTPICPAVQIEGWDRHYLSSHHSPLFSILRCLLSGPHPLPRLLSWDVIAHSRPLQACVCRPCSSVL